MARSIDMWGAGFETTAHTTKISRPLFNLFYRESQLVKRKVLRDWVSRAVGFVTFVGFIGVFYMALLLQEMGDKSIMAAKASGGF